MVKPVRLTPPQKEDSSTFALREPIKLILDFFLTLITYVGERDRTLIAILMIVAIFCLVVVGWFGSDLAMLVAASCLLLISVLTILIVSRNMEFRIKDEQQGRDLAWAEFRKMRAENERLMAENEELRKSIEEVCQKE